MKKFIEKKVLELVSKEVHKRTKEIRLIRLDNPYSKKNKYITYMVSYSGKVLKDDN